MPQLGYWVGTLTRRLVTQMPDEVLDLFVRRVARLDGYGSSLDAIPYREIDGVFEPLTGDVRLGELVRRVRDLAPTAQGFQTFALGHLFRAVSLNFGPEGLAALREWLDVGDPLMVNRAMSLLAEADPAFVFDRREFVAYALERAETPGRSVFTKPTPRFGDSQQVASDSVRLANHSPGTSPNVIEQRRCCNISSRGLRCMAYSRPSIDRPLLACRKNLETMRRVE